ncbi:MAG: M23 family metallopeptidase [Verrucomicrobiales bacterium]
MVCRFRSQHLKVLLLAAAAGCVWSVSATDTSKVPLADGFDYPVGKPDGQGYYVFRGYWPNGHLGEDWNGNGGGNTDLGDPVYATGDGLVVFSQDYRRGWGNVIILRHAYRERDGQVQYIDSLYGHLDRREVNIKDIVKRGQQIGTIGTAHGKYYAHLHFEIRKNLRIGMARSSYDKGYSSYHSPRTFINAHRKLRPENRWHPVPVNTFSHGESPQAANQDPPKEIRVPKKEDNETKRNGNLDEALERILEENRKIPEVTDEEMDGFWKKLKTKLKAKRDARK